MRLSYLFLLIGAVCIVVGISNLPNLPQWDYLPTVLSQSRMVGYPVFAGLASLLFGAGWWIFVDRKR